MRPQALNLRGEARDAGLVICHQTAGAPLCLTERP